MSPPVIVIDEFEGETFPTGYETKLLDVKVKFEEGYLLATFARAHFFFEYF